jgi:hypothetical protein
MRIAKSGIVLGMALLTMTGCAGRMLGGPWVVPGVLVGAELGSAMSQPTVIVVEQPARLVYGPPFEPEPVVPESATPPFDAVRARSALEAIDVAHCWAPGAAHGYGKARVTFGPSGGVDRVEITNPPEGGLPDKACIARSYGAARVPTFEGAGVSVPATFYVR